MTTTITDDVVLANENLIFSIINKYTYFFDKDDLYQVAVIGLLTAYKNFNPNMNTKFTSYAYFYIKGEVRKFIRESHYFKVSKELIKLNRSIEHAKEVLTNRFGRTVTNEEISIFLKIDYKQLEEARLANEFITSLDNDNEETRNIYETIGSTPKEYDESILDLKAEVSKLDDQDQRLIRERYEYGLTQSETSEELGMTQVQVSRKEKAILTRLRRNLS